MVCRVAAANCALGMTSPSKVGLEASCALRPCFRNKRWVLSTARALGAFLSRCWLGCFIIAQLCTELASGRSVESHSMRRPALRPRSSLHARWLPQDARVCVHRTSAADVFFFCAVTSFHRPTERSELNGGRSVALRLMRRPVRTPRSSLHARWLLLDARLGVWVVDTGGGGGGGGGGGAPA